MRIACGFDHAGLPLRDAVVAGLEEDGHTVVDAGSHDDYPYAAAAVARALAEGAERAVLVCGSGAGVSVAASKLPGVRAATIHDGYTAHQGVEHHVAVLLQRRHDDVAQRHAGVVEAADDPHRLETSRA